jgi:hypothetical protein
LSATGTSTSTTRVDETEELFWRVVWSMEESIFLRWLRLAPLSQVSER